MNAPEGNDVRRVTVIHDLQPTPAWMRICTYAAVVPFGLGSSLDWTLITKAEVAAENGLAWTLSGTSVEWSY